MEWTVKTSWDLANDNTPVFSKETERMAANLLMLCAYCSTCYLFYVSDVTR
jgi:hypothetical protein